MIDLSALIDQCVNPRHKVVMEAIVKVESKGNPLVLGLNKGYKLKTQPKDQEQAKAWAEFLEQHDYNFDVGIAQVNITNVHKYGYKAIDMLDPCLNLKIASDIFDKNHQAAMATNNSANALQKAISAYNTGNFINGFKNGYVDKVNRNLNMKLALNDDIPPIVATSAAKISKKPVQQAVTHQGGLDEHPQVDEANPYTSKSVLFVAPPRKATPTELADATYKK